MARARVKQPPPSRKAWVLLMLLTLAMAAAAAVAQTWTNLSAIDYGYKLSKATRQRARLLETNRRLRIELALLKRPERIARLAARAGYQPPEPSQVERIKAPGNASRPLASRAVPPARTRAAE